MKERDKTLATTSDRILEAAVDVLVERGLDGFTTPVVAAIAGVAQGTLFRHFPTKRELLAATTARAIDVTMADHARSFAAKVQRPATDVELVRLAIETLRDAYFDDRIAAANEVRSRSRTDPELHAALVPILATADTFGADAVALLLPESFRSSGDDFRAVARLVTSSLQGRAMARIALPDPNADAELVDTLIALAVSVMAAPSPAAPGRGV